MPTLLVEALLLRELGVLEGVRVVVGLLERVRNRLKRVRYRLQRMRYRLQRVRYRPFLLHLKQVVITEINI